MAKKMGPLGIMNLMGAAAQKRSQMPSKRNPDPDGDGDDDTTPEGDTDHDYQPSPKGNAPKNPKEIAAIKAKSGKGNPFKGGK